MNERFTADTVVAGAGIVGLAVARALAMAGHRVLVLEQEARIGQHQSSRNSEVIHAGIYYEPGSLKASLAVAGRDELYRYAGLRGIPHRRIGKLVVATEAGQLDKLSRMAERAEACGALVSLLDADEARAREPALSCLGALWSPATGIIDTHAYMLALQGDAESHGAEIVLNARVEGGAVGDGRVRLEVRAPEPVTVTCRLFLNCGGLFAPALARRLEGYPADRAPEAWFARGNYFQCSARVPFGRLIYPVPDAVGLGIHLTFDLAGRARFGPDVELVDEVDYRVGPGREAHFYESVRRYWPGLPDGSLEPAYAGVRAKIGPRGAAQDFVIETQAEHGVPGLVNLFGVESPGMTTSLALAREVVRRLARAEERPPSPALARAS